MNDGELTRALFSEQISHYPIVPVLRQISRNVVPAVDTYGSFESPFATMGERRFRGRVRTRDKARVESAAPDYRYVEVMSPLDVARTIEAVHHALDQDQIIDGFQHPAESILSHAFRLEPEIFATWFKKCLTNESETCRTAEILRLLGRINPHTPEWRRAIIGEALSSQSVELRDAAIQAVEAWAEPTLTALLRGHKERVPWLAAYAAQVVQDLEG